MSEPLRNPSLDAALIDVVADWLMEQALADTEMEDLVNGCCRRLRAAGMPLSRAMISYRTLHPLFEAIWLRWDQTAGVGTYEMPHGETGTRLFHNSPVGDSRSQYAPTSSSGQPGIATRLPAANSRSTNIAVASTTPNPACAAAIAASSTSKR
ncbi:MAG: hypothetical protein P8Q36_19125 [Alphaproteobacteria bacterium]|nr:hypothetical protein [Alphaproteobacteria bacterium]